MTPPPLRFVFGLHLHQPVGNFDWVFEEHTDAVYLPLLRFFDERDLGPVLLHISGPLLDWLEARAHPLVDLVSRMADRGAVELLAAGYYEPVLAALDPQDRVHQVARLREHLRMRFGQDARTLWLTERVWEPSLPPDLARAGIDTVLVDDRHLHAAGLGEDAAFRSWRTEDQGEGVWVVGIDEGLRYSVPFRPAEDVTGRLRYLHDQGHRMAVLADDGEKFGGWPDTHEWVWEQGWMTRFGDVLERLRDENVAVLSTMAEAHAVAPRGGPVYLPTGSYREMEGWTLPPLHEAARSAAEARLRAAGAPEEELRWVRGGHWRNFLARYPESNRMHKKCAALSRRVRERGDPPAARTAMSRAQCNDAYWHGVFGGLYLPHLRHAVWAELAQAESILRRGEPYKSEELDLDGDGELESWVHSSFLSAVIAPHRGGALEELTFLASGRNLADVLTRRREAYHLRSAAEGGSAATADAVPPTERTLDEHAPSDHAPSDHASTEEGTASIHHREAALTLDGMPTIDARDLTLFRERIVRGEGGADADEVASWADALFVARTARSTREGGFSLILEVAGGGPWLTKRFHFGPGARLEVELAWDGRAHNLGSRFETVLALAWPARVTCTPPAIAETRNEIVTLSRTEQGWESCVQGETLVLSWPVATDRVRVVIEEAADD